MAILAWVLFAQAPVCLPGTTLCAESDGRGGVRIDASGRAQGSPAGASATGQANADASGNANANAAGGGTAGAGADGSGSVAGGGYYRTAHGRFGTGLTLCPLARVGVWSGFKAGGCLAIGFRWDAAWLELETQLLYGGVTHAFDWSLTTALVVPLANDKSLFQGPYLRFGGSPIGATFARDKDGGSFVRFGWFAGGGYELNISDALAWRVFDLRFSFDVGTRRSLDDRGHWFDPGVQLGTGLVL
jgi:hypothetical protein